MNYVHYTEDVPQWVRGTNRYIRRTKHTFGFKLGGKYLVVTWCWC